MISTRVIGNGLLRRTTAVAAVALLAGPLACVTKGTYEGMVTERDAIAEKNADLELQMQSLEASKESISSQAEMRERDVAKLRGTYDALVSDLKDELASGSVEIVQLREGIRLSVADEVLFPSGSAELNIEGSDVLDKVAAQIANLPNRIEILGHSDDVPISGGLARRYPTNWELAGARAARVVRFLEERGIDGERLKAVSQGKHAPVASNDSPEGRSRNRRIEIRLAPLEGSAAPPASF